MNMLQLHTVDTLITVVCKIVQTSFYWPGVTAHHQSQTVFPGRDHLIDTKSIYATSDCENNKPKEVTMGI